MSMDVIGVITGPTATGKTALSIELSKLLDAEIISADSIQVYKGLDIGSAKPAMSERCGIVHHMMDVVELDAPGWGVARYQQMAKACILDILGRGRFPLVAGGTGLYVNSLVFPLDFTGAPPNEELRKQLMTRESEEPGSLYAELASVDPASAKRLHANDIKRIVRALEVIRATGRPMSEAAPDFRNEAARPIEYDIRMIGLNMERSRLYERINKRVDAMMEAGLLEETKAMLAMGYSRTLPGFEGIGYKQLIKYLDGEYSLDEAVEQIKRETRRFAKRQLTWFKRDKRIVWLDAEDDIESLVAAALKVMTGEG